MKRYFYIAIISGFVTSCTNDNTEEFLPQNKKIETTDFSNMEKDSDTSAIANTTTSTTNPNPDTGGQGGSIPIKPPKL